MVLPSGHMTLADAGRGVVHFSTGQTVTVGGGLQLQTGQPLGAITCPYGQKMAHAGPPQVGGAGLQPQS